MAQNNEDWLIKAPAFDVTKVQTVVAGLVVAVLGAVPASLQADRSVVIASIAAGTLILLGVLGLVAMDIKTRQRAEEAKLRYGEPKKPDPPKVLAVPAKPLRVMRDTNDNEYEAGVLTVAEKSVSLAATRNGETIGIDFDVLAAAE